MNIFHNFMLVFQWEFALQNYFLLGWWASSTLKFFVHVL